MGKENKKKTCLKRIAELEEEYANCVQHGRAIIPLNNIEKISLSSSEKVTPLVDGLELELIFRFENNKQHYTNHRIFPFNNNYYVEYNYRKEKPKRKAKK